MNMGMERGRMRKEPDNQSSGKATAKINRKTVAAAATFLRGNKDPYDSDSEVLLSQEPVDADTSIVTKAAPRDSVEQGVRSSPEDTAKPVELVAIFPKNTNFITKIRTSLLESDDDNAVNLDLNADTIFPDRTYLKR